MGKTIKKTPAKKPVTKTTTTETKTVEKKERTREGKSLRQLRSGSGKPEHYCDNCKCKRCTPCTCQKKVKQ